MYEFIGRFNDGCRRQHGSKRQHVYKGDIAAPWLIIHEAGGTIRDVYNQELKFELFEKSISRNYSIMAGSCSILNEIGDGQYWFQD